MNYNPQNIEDGVYTDMPIEVYHENKTHLSASSVKESFKSLAHFKSYVDSDSKKALHFDFGNAFELSIVDDKAFEKEVSVYDEDKRPEPKKTFGSKLNKDWKQEFYDENKDKLIIPISGTDSVDTIVLLKDSLYSHPAAKMLLQNTEYQTSVFWTCPNTGLKLKTRPDFWKPENKNRGAVITDLKTDVNSESDQHLKKIRDLMYPVQSCMQIKGLQAAKLIGKSYRFFWVVCSKSDPFNTEVYEFDSTDIEPFMEQLDFKLEEIKRAKDKGVFLSYEPERDFGIKAVEFPYWYKQKLGIVEKFEA